MNGLDLFGNFEPLNVAFNNQAEVVGGNNVDVRPNNLQHQQQEVEEDINVIDVNGSLANPMLAALEMEIRNYNTDFENAYTVIATAIAKNKELLDEKKINLVIRQNEKEGEIPDPEEIPKPQNRGFWGYIFGAIQVVAGACLAICSSGMLYSLGVGMILNGIDLIQLNYEMNKNGTYNDKDIFKKIMIDTCTAFTLAGLTNIASLRAMLPNNVYGGLLDGVSSLNAVAAS
jgi:hypothetical protein